MRRFVVSMWLCVLCTVLSARSFTHPGVLHNLKSFEVMKQQIEKNIMPAYGSWMILKAHPCSQFDYELRGPYKVISRDGEYAYTKGNMERDFSAAYQNSLMWMLTGDKRHAEKSLDILTAYADTLQYIPETNDAPLLAGLEGMKIVYAAEILKYTYKEADASSLAKISKMILTVFLPVLENFYAREPYTNGNWGPVATKTYMAIAIWSDNAQMYEKAKDFYLNAHDNGTIKNYISGDTGQCQESGRDQGHPQLGLGAMATICEMAWIQGDDLYSALDNRLLKGYEYTARYNLGYDVPYVVWKDITGKYSDWQSISSHSRGSFKPVYEIVYNHYVLRKHLEMPYTKEVLDKIRPEGFERDQPAFGSLLFWNK